nr:enoyl-CoA hydratase/isomerase family protein [uncultured Azospirillum sp.]
MTYETILYAVADGVAEIRLNRPQRSNAVVKQLYDDLNHALDAAEADRSIRVVLLTGEGRAFCKRLLQLSKPVVAAVNGFALGAGAEMAIASDFIVMAESARIGLPEIGIGTFLGGGVTLLLPRLVGLAKARELVFLGERIDGAEAVRIGLAARCFPDDGFLDHARAFARQLSTKAPLSMALAKEQLAMAADRTLDAALTAELEGMMFCSTTRDWQEGVDAFAEKRAPIFRGE